MDRETILHARAAALLGAREANGGSGANDAAAAHHERLLELVPGHPEATEFLAARYARLGRPADVEEILVGRLASLGAPGENDGGLRTALALRISTLRSEELDDLPGAVAALEPAVEQDGPLGPATAPLADLYRLAGREEELVELCERTAAACVLPRERGIWLLRLGDELKDGGHTERAADAYARALAACPDHHDAEDALCDLYRQTGQAVELCQILERQLARPHRAGEIVIRLELAHLLESELGRKSDALTHLQRIVDLEPGHGPAFDHAMRLAGELGRHDDQVILLDARLADPVHLNDHFQCGADIHVTPQQVRLGVEDFTVRFKTVEQDAGLQVPVFVVGIEFDSTVEMINRGIQ